MPDNLGLRKFVHSQLWLDLPYPEAKFTGKTIIVTGANSGLGLEAVRHFVRLDAARVILAVRNEAKGEEAIRSVVVSTGRQEVAQVWKVDIASATSIEAFASRVNAELDRLDVVVQNAGVFTFQPFSLLGDDEFHITTNVIGTFHLSILLLPKLRETTSVTGEKTTMTFTSSWMHKMVSNFAEQDAEDILKALSNHQEGQKVANR
jgi:retinol dehydrogenase 12